MFGEIWNPGQCIDCTGKMFVDGAYWTKDVRLRAFSFDFASNCRAEIVISGTLVESELYIHGYSLDRDSSIENCDVTYNLNIHAISTKYSNTYYAGAGVYCFAVSTYDRYYNIANLTSAYSMNFSYDTPGNSSKDVYGICRFFYNYARIADSYDSIWPEYIDSECKIYEFTNNSATAWPTIKDTCLW